MNEAKRQDELKKEWGQHAEELAADYLLTEGYIIRERNWRPRNSHLEVDIIAQRGRDIVFVEVKARHSDFVDAAEAVDEKKRRRLVRAANIYLGSIPEDFDYRFDVITVTPRGVTDPEEPRSSFAAKYAPEGPQPTLKTEEYVLDHLEDAFLPRLSGPL